MPLRGNGREPGEAGRAIGLWCQPHQEWRREGRKDGWVEACLIAVYSNEFSKAVGGALKPSESHASNCLPLAGGRPQVARLQLKHIYRLQITAGALSWLFPAVGRLFERHMSGPPRLVSFKVKQDNIHAHLTPRAVVWLREGDVYEYFVNSKVWSM